MVCEFNGDNEINKNKDLKKLIEYFASEVLPTYNILPFISLRKLNPIHEILNNFINSLPENLIENHILSPGFKLRNIAEDRETQIFKGRIDYTSKLITDIISKKRLEMLLNQHLNNRPQPYTHPDLVDMNLSPHFLVNMRDFDLNKGLLNRNDTIFQITPSLPAHNSLYWVQRNLFELNLSKINSIRIRIDPFMIKSLNKYNPIFYKMLIYGRNLDWERIERIKDSEHCSWCPDDEDANDWNKTDLVWIKRDDGVHFLCEEVPNTKEILKRGSRYFHSIFNPKTKLINHADGSIRIYSKNDLENRIQTHVRKIGKIGVHVKLFEINGEISQKKWSELVQNFFIWNEDIRDYFQSEIFI